MKNRYSFLFVVAVSFAVAVLFRSTAQCVRASLDRRDLRARAAIPLLPSSQRWPPVPAAGLHGPRPGDASGRKRAEGKPCRPQLAQDPSPFRVVGNLLHAHKQDSTRHAQGNVEFPQDISLFLSGGWTTHIGSFVQVTYTKQDDHFSIDNSDVRYANLRRWEARARLRFDAQQHQTVEDLWNTTPAWGYPFMASDSARPRQRLRSSRVSARMWRASVLMRCGMTISILRKRSTARITLGVLLRRWARASPSTFSVSLPTGGSRGSRRSRETISWKSEASACA